MLITPEHGVRTRLRQAWPVAPSRVTVRRTVIVSLVVTAALVATNLLTSVHTFEDLDVYRSGVLAWLHGGDMYGRLPPPRTGVPLPFIYPPFAALVLSPLAMVPWGVSWIAMAALSMMSLAAALYLTARRVWASGGRGGAAVLASAALPLSLLLDPVAQTFWFGQVNMVLMALVVLDCLARRPRWPRGVLIGIAAAIKLTPAAFILFLLLRKDYRAAATALGTFVGAALLGFAVAPGSSWKYWTGSAGGITGLAGSPFASNQAIRGALARFHQLPAATQSALWLALCVVTLAIATLAMLRALRACNVGLALACNAALSLLVSPISWGHHWVYVAPALLVMAGEAARLRSLGWTVATGATAVIFVLHPYHFLPKDHDHEFGWSWWQHLIGNTYGLLSIGLLTVLAWPELRRVRARRAARRDTSVR
ncbi:MAG: glycosyltransferase 87 family protein [Sciscionella sp.]